MTDSPQNAYHRAVEFLYDLQWFGAKLGLENTEKLAALAGNPERDLRFIHVAGTNGKGSTCAMLEAVYRAAGYRVGLFTSPHMVSFRERIQVNRQMIPIEDVIRLAGELKNFLRNFSEEDHPTFFEAVTVMALLYFAEKECDMVIWETGLGGRLDATNIVMPVASVITNIQLDHQKWLGETVDRIAAEKAGIIKPAAPAIIGADQPEVLSVIRETAASIGAPIEIVVDNHRIAEGLEGMEIGLRGEHQKRNAAVALATIRMLQSRFPVTDAAIREGLATVQWLGRLQTFMGPSGQAFVLDGAHNPAGAEALINALRDHRRGASLTLLMGILQDKAWEQVCQILAPVASRIILVPVQNERTTSPDLLTAVCRLANPNAEVIGCDSLQEGLRVAGLDEAVVITGSLYLVGEAMELLGITPGTDFSERGLNEWTTKR